MKEIKRAEGAVVLRLPDSAGDVTDQTGPASSYKGTGRRPPTGKRTGAQDDQGNLEEVNIILDALIEDESPLNNPFEVVDRFAVDVGNGNSRQEQTSRGVRTKTPTGKNADGTADKQELNIDLDLGLDESAVVLIEQDGTYEWHYPAKHKKTVQRGQGGASRAGPRDVQHASVLFRIPIGDTGQLPRPSQGRRNHRGPITSFIKGKIQGFILKFVAKKALGALTKRLERGVVEGPVIVNSATDATLWTHPTAYPVTTLTDNRARRILLLVHGTFSSTLGSYGALTAHKQGQSFLREALTHYDLVIGFDHYTLSETPEQNAEALLTSLMPFISNGQALEIDAISFSRGGLVYRYLSELLIPAANVPIVCRNAIFVGCTNKGTELATSDNWKHLIDFYTNMIAGATRLIGLAPGAALPTRILRQGIKVIGSLVTYIAQEGVSNNSVPGVAAMEPAGDFITAINTVPRTRTIPGARAYYAIGSNFEPDSESDAFKLGRRLVLKVADGFVDKLMGRANDLVVNNDSMFVIDPVPGARLVEQRTVNANGRIYHTVYFHQAMVADVCAKWLGISSTPAVTRQSASGTSAMIESSLPRNWWSDAVSDDFLLLPATSSVSETRKRLKSANMTMVVLQRLHKSELLYYGFTRQYLISATKGATDQHISLGDQLGLNEWQSQALSMDDALQASSASELREKTAVLEADNSPSAFSFAVITDNEKPVGVVMPIMHESEFVPDLPPPIVTGDEQPGVTRGQGAATSSTSAQIERASGEAPQSQWESAAGSEGPSLRDNSDAVSANDITPERVWCNMHAIMPEEIQVNAITSLEVTLSRDLIERESGISGSGEVATETPLIIQVLARKHCDVIGSDRVEISVPELGEEASIMFDIKALHIGVGEVDIFARQGNRPIIKLKLRPRFIKRSAKPTERNTAVTGTLQPASPTQELPDVLYIYDVQVGAQRILEFNFQARNLGVQGRYRSDAFKNEGARQAYIANLYTEIEEFWADDQNDYDAFMEHLMARGANLFDKLVPKEVQSLLWNARNDIKGIQVYSDDPFVPWELLYLKQPGKPAKTDSCFLVEKGLFRWVSNTRFAPSAIRLRDGAFKHIVPKYPTASGYALEGAQQERKMLESRFSAKAITASGRAVKKSLTMPDENDILHFACHGLAESSSIWNSGLLMQGKMNEGDYVQDELSYEWTSTFADLHSVDGSGPLVFLNACQTGRQGYNLTGTGGFAQAFIEAGASAFIGSHWSVGDQPALVFSETFYRELLNNGETMMDAVGKAREAARNNKEVTWLAYAVYADPFARIVHE